MAIRARLEKLGLFRETGHEHFAGSITFPICAADGTGQIVDIYGCKMLGATSQGHALDCYLADQRRRLERRGVRRQ